MKQTILIVDDEERVREIIRLYLEKEGFRVDTAEDGETALKKFKENKPHLVVLDVMLPQMDGWDVCREIRKYSDIPLIMLSARGEELDRIVGLELGADDYLPKPFSPRELTARVKAVLRRSSKEKSTHDVLSFDGLKINYAARKVELQEKNINFTPREFDLLWFLASNAGRVFSRRELLENVWGYDYLGDGRTVDTHIKRIRAKLNSRMGERYIKTVWGIGYKFEVST